MLTRLWKFVDLARNILGPLKLSKNMLGKSILIGLFVLNNNRTIGGPKSLQGGWERQLSSHALSRPITAGTGYWGWVFAWPVTTGTGVNGLSKLSVSAMNVSRVSSFTSWPFRVIFRAFFADLTSLSQTPPKWGAEGG